MNTEGPVQRFSVTKSCAQACELWWWRNGRGEGRASKCRREGLPQRFLTWFCDSKEGGAALLIGRSSASRGGHMTFMGTGVTQGCSFCCVNSVRRFALKTVYGALLALMSLPYGEGRGH